MKTKNHFSVIILFVFVSSLFCSCGNLSRSNAKNLILKQLHSDQSKPIWNRESVLFLDFDVNSFTGKIRLGSQQKREVELLLKEGYITLVNNTNFDLNSKVKPFITFNNGCYIIFATMKDVNITGITGDDKYKEVQYEIIYTLNSLGEDISYSRGLTRQKSIRFRKFDDGWRIE